MQMALEMLSISPNIENREAMLKSLCNVPEGVNIVKWLYNTLAKGKLEVFVVWC